ncbi:hypothetical protein BGZ61DRAFT_450252 [Ilyonectria robusta]|uniref:uncharacterized protein n=1 Tax=Ilyonectria robusta TaxID=1079257 RepID=UPI001E8CD7E3|nr:uncharacterized protein BGZ61DRAFT_450252 [Ilyonectria robusta]KAH8706643.1 hypothetical protein BGZ61DRAFT_450252 [Ilyonectria robusta]
MAPTRILRFARTDDTSAFVLLQVTPKGSRALDLKLVGTEGEAPYTVSLKQDRVSSLRVQNCPASESEWQAILESLFKQEPLPDIQATATVQSEASISITIRKETQGITQRLGAIALEHDPDEAIELFEWCGAAVEASAAGKQDVADLRVKSHDSEAAVAQLKSQLEELIQAKDKDETVLLQKFRDLLNEKKVKIREQQQVLATSSFNASHPGSSQPSQPPAPTRAAEPAKPARKAGQSRTTKRKTPPSKMVKEESEDDAGVQAMDVDVKEEVEDTDPGNTTEATASGASDEDEDDNNDDDDDDDPPTNTMESTSQRRAEPQKLPAKKGTDAPPPRRDLPFNNKPALAPAGSETDSDDEL